MESESVKDMGSQSLAGREKNHKGEKQMQKRRKGNEIREEGRVNPNPSENYGKKEKKSLQRILEKKLTKGVILEEDAIVCWDASNKGHL